MGAHYLHILNINVGLGHAISLLTHIYGPMIKKSCGISEEGLNCLFVIILTHLPFNLLVQTVSWYAPVLILEVRDRVLCKT